MTNCTHYTCTKKGRDREFFTLKKKKRPNIKVEQIKSKDEFKIARIRYILTYNHNDHYMYNVALVLFYACTSFFLLFNSLVFLDYQKLFAADVLDCLNVLVSSFFSII